MTRSSSPASPSSQPTFGRAASVLWFPIVFAALFAALALGAFTHPAAHQLRLGVVGSQAQVDALAGRLDRDHPAGFRTTPYATSEQAATAVRTQAVSAAVVLGDRPELVVASAGGATRVSYLVKALPSVLTEEGWRSALTVRDVVPLRARDQTGNAVFFWALPLMVVGMVTAILLLQFAVWPAWRKAASIAVIGSVSSVLVWAIAVATSVLPAQPLLLVYGFMLTQAIGWIATGMTPFVKQYFVAVAMTFVLALGVPSAGGTVVGDLLPGPTRWLNAFMPLAQTVSLARAAAYFDGHGTLRPLLILLGWLLLGAALMLAMHRRRGVAQQRVLAAGHAREAAAATAEAGAGPERGHVLSGTIVSTSGTPLAGATVIAVDGSGARVASASSGTDGSVHDRGGAVRCAARGGGGAARRARDRHRRGPSSTAAGAARRRPGRLGRAGRRGCALGCPILSLDRACSLSAHGKPASGRNA
ncbi:hypothetical protein [Nocardioides sp. Iso805N]|uniref:hypothetical protein n=1 Tax=Nocardioides sp. Iso805N TaxID=1283287 RepID=UPI00037B8456|nr:hypothetical protein [Nocardioides sp. Iso805N]